VLTLTESPCNHKRTAVAKGVIVPLSIRPDDDQIIAELTSQLQDAVQRFVAGERMAIAGDAIDALALRLLELVFPPSVSRSEESVFHGDSLSAIAWLHWCRVQPGDRPGFDAQVSAGLFFMVYFYQPHVPPDELRDKFEHVTDTFSDVDRYLEAAEHYVSSVFLYARRYSSMPLLDALIDSLRVLAASVMDQPVRQAAFLADLAALHVSRFQLTADEGDLAAAVAIGTLAAEQGTTETRLQAWQTVSIALRESFEVFGDAEHLDAAIGLARKALGLATGEGRMRPELLACLGATLRIRHDRYGSTADLREAVDCLTEALDTLPEDYEYTATVLSNTAASWLSMYRINGDPAALNRAISYSRDATGREHPLRSRYLSNLGVALLQHHRDRRADTASLTDVDEAIHVLGQAVEDLRRKNAPLGIAAMLNLASALHERYLAIADRSDLDQAIDTARAALSDIGQNPGIRATGLAKLAVYLAERAERDGNPGDQAAALELWREAMTTPGAPSGVSVLAASYLGAFAMEIGDFGQAIDGFQQAIALLPRLVFRGLHRQDRERLLETVRGLPSDAAAAAIAAGRTELAVELLEQGRNVLWTQLLELRSDLDALREAEPELAGRLVQIREALDRADYGSYQPGGSGSVYVSEEQRMALSKEWDDLVERARTVPGFTEFLRPIPFIKFQEAVPRGWLVIVNASRFRSDAILITASSTTVIPLPELNWPELVDRSGEFLAALQPSTEDQMITRNAVITATLEWLWDVAARPVVNSLPATGQTRLWWYRTGLLSLLPLHAAGRSMAESVHSRTVSSYLSSLRVLLPPRVRNPDRKPGGSLVVALPDTPGMSPLTATTREAEGIKPYLRDPVIMFRNSREATREKVLAALPGKSVAHFACHAHHDPTNTGRTGLALGDGLVDIAELSRVALAEMDFVYLSACNTASEILPLLDEAVHLAAAMQFAGCRHVIATLWQAYDKTSATMATWIYKSMRESGVLDASLAPFALHTAVLKLRDKIPDEPLRWAPYVHFGQ
jgi:tetratricopeptide (TPR) repeat protein